MTGHQEFACKREHEPDAQGETLSEILDDERSRAVIEALADADGELHLSELTEEVLEREREHHGIDRPAKSAVPWWVYTGVSGAGLISLIGSYVEVGPFTILSVTDWTGMTFGLLLPLAAYTAIVQRRG
ncbi:hypothetical protein [Halegenticoccus tardaugens]|uniref:hypothetical protein n=1 Tax=Halegenticoccus tardaugens TaxID=2071624 RepID=UPI00100B8F02|nr:hypothetical protein [Halegenticoccus tardaugens]